MENFFDLAMLVLVNVIQGRYQKKLMAEKEEMPQPVF